MNDDENFSAMNDIASVIFVVIVLALLGSLCVYLGESFWKLFQ